MSFQIKVRDLIPFIEKDGWRLKNTEGDHHHYVHPSKSGKVTLVGERSDDVGGYLLNSILRSAGLTMKELRAWLSR